MTGCAGFVGSHLAEHLIAAGAHVTGLVREPSPDSYLVRQGVASRIGLARADVLDEAALRRVVGLHEPGFVFHLAARSVAGSGAGRHRENVGGARALMRCVQEASPRAVVVLASSVSVYGSRAPAPITEDAPLAPASAYAASKAAVERLARRGRSAHGLRIGIARLSNVYGSGDRNLERLVPGTVHALLRGEVPEIRDGTATRDYVHVDDATAALLRLAFAMGEAHLDGGTFNVASGRDTSTAEVVRQLAALCRRPDLLPPMRGGAGPRPRLCVARARRVLGWRPRIDLHTGLERTLAWYATAAPAPSPRAAGG